MKRQIISGLAAVAAMASVTPAFAGTASGTLTSTLNVVTTCTIGAGGGNALLDFGTVPAQTLTSPLDADTGATLQINCDGSASSPTLAIGASANLVSGSRALKATVGGVDRFIPYALFKDAGRTTPFPINTPVTIPALTAGANTEVIYGRIPTGTIDQGTYTDVVPLTVTF
ncbi:Csu type fimbrial protein [Aquisediminimonas profunda]|uniref:Csu type fimbrial protein n=1 Tax=Aquisediminimonas profunda TaxID=1550733 RepID=UPI001C62E1D9|nr:spore coat protein U domain-containing protein [Aquisediminimonas profunda]